MPRSGRRSAWSWCSALGNRTRIDISAQPDRNPRFVQLSDGQVRNGYTVKIRNMEARPRTVEVAIEGLPGAAMWTEAASREQAGPNVRDSRAARCPGPVRVFVAAPGGGGEAHDEIHFTVRALDEEGGGDRVDATLRAARAQ